jgi:Polyketide cyclase / dehydrase and lipid transport
MNTSGMTIRSESRLAIASSVPEVWAYLCDVARWPQWAPTVAECWVDGGGPLAPGARVEQRAKMMFGATRHRAQHVTLVDAPSSLAFAGTMGTSAARWGMEFAPIDGGGTEAEMWVEVDLSNVMRALPSRAFKGRIQRVMDIEMAAIKVAVESAAPSRAPTPTAESRRNGVRPRSTR